MRPEASATTVAARPIAAGPTPAVDAEGHALAGRIDAVDNGRLFGWVWCPADPQARVEVRLLSGEAEIARIPADKPRIDLRRNGIGDGAHAFDLRLPKDATGLRVLARHAGSGAEIELPLPGASGGAEAAAAAPFGLALDRLDFLIGRLHQLQTGQRALAKQVKALADRETAPAPAAPLPVVTGEEPGRVEALEAVLVRFDATLGGFDKRLQELTRRHQFGVAPHLLLLSALVGLLAGVALAAGVGV